MFNTSNPILSSRNFAATAGEGTATLPMTINRCLILLSLVFGAAVFTWIAPGTNTTDIGGKLMLFALFGFVTAIVTMVKKEWAAITAPLYAILEGCVLGAMSKLFELVYPGIVFQAVILTFGVAFGMLTLYRIGVIKVTDKFRMIVGSALFGIFILYIMSWILALFGVSIPLLHSSGLLGLAFSAFVVVIAALSLVMDFDFIVQVSRHRLPAYMSWFAAFGLMVTLVWLYLEVLRLLAKLRDHSR